MNMNTNLSMATLSYQQAVAHHDPGSVAAAESVKARIQSAYVMAMQVPRNEEQSRARILEACKRPEFAERTEYSKPVSGNRIVGPSIRFAELAVREWGNVMTETQVAYEDDLVRRVKITLIDLQSNTTFSKEIQVSKTVERKNDKGREVVGQRVNTYGKPVFIVKATDDEIHNKEAALISKVIRNEGLRLIPSDIVDEAIMVARKTLQNRDAKDPKAGKRRVLDAFVSIGVQPKDIEKYLGHSLDTLSPTELQDLRGIYQAINGGEASWNDYAKRRENGADETAPPDDLNAKLDAEPMPDAPPPPSAPGQEPPSAPEDAQSPSRTANRPTKAEMQERRDNALSVWLHAGGTREQAESLVNAFLDNWTTAQCERIVRESANLPQEHAQANESEPAIKDQLDVIRAYAQDNSLDARELAMNVTGREVSNLAELTRAEAERVIDETGIL